MEEGYTRLPTSHLLGSVPAVVAEEKPSASATSPASLQVFPPANGGYAPPESPHDRDEQATNNWKGLLSLSSYTSYFDVDTDVVVDRIISSVYPMNDFSRKIDGNPDLYGLVWISTTMVFMFAALGNYASYLIHKRSEPNGDWKFDVNYVNWAAGVMYGYAIVVPAAFYFLLQYFGLNASLLLLVVPSEIVRWIIIILAGSASSWFIYLNLKVYTEGSNMMMLLVVIALALQFALAIFIKIFFFA